MGSVCQAFDRPAALLFSCGCWHVGRVAMVVAPPPTHDSAVSPCSHGCLASFHRHFPPAASSLISPRSLSQQSTSALALALLCNPYAPAPSCCTF